MEVCFGRTCQPFWVGLLNQQKIILETFEELEASLNYIKDIKLEKLGKKGNIISVFV
ncbi:hypothetical protein MTR_8g470160 [Medicago truncatula]|uniref:Uncharacterized protein n=1 Tax=Medicago truncatula TaxID=3880 RepID=A0A072TR99_MEDTR|nr:hypothetical protein MTR_8g470160 [Medicago truncatula]